MKVKHIGLAISFVLLICCDAAAQIGGPSPDQLAYRQPPVCEKIQGLTTGYQGRMATLLEALTDQWLIPAPLANPAMTGMFRAREWERDSIPGAAPYDNILPWSGGFIGWHILAAQTVSDMTGDQALQSVTDSLVRAFISTQAEDGYLGPFSRETRFTTYGTWDWWGHYHAILALLMYHEAAGYEPALRAACRAADLLCDQYLGTGISLSNECCRGEMNYAFVHAILLLYKRTGNPRYMELADWVMNMWEREDGPQYMTYALAGRPVVEFPAHRWESAPNWQAMAERYFLTGEAAYRDAFLHIWKDLLLGDRHNTGGWTTFEQVRGDPYLQGPIESCCTMAWIALSIDMLRMTGDPLVVDEIELSTLNGSIGGMHCSGRWWTYNTPMDGVKRASYHDIGFQIRAGSPELNCCSANAPRGIGLINHWALMQSPGSIWVNYYGPVKFDVPLDDGRTLTMIEKTDYPRDGRIHILVDVKEPLDITLKLRIPSWSESTTVSLNGEPVGDILPGTYLSLDRTWMPGDELALELDMSLHFWPGEKACAGKVSIYAGPILLALDQRFNDGMHTDPPVISAGLPAEQATDDTYPAPLCLYRMGTTNNKTIILCDFATAGQTGTLYRTWLQVDGLRPSGLAKGMPIWTHR